jgi:hypothetical protein
MEEFPAETFFKEERYEIESLINQEGKIWVYNVQDNKEKFKRYRRFLLAKLFKNI